MLGGSVVIESVFAIPGFGRLAQEAVAGRDAPLLIGIILTSAVLVILVNLAVDLVYAVLDPRIGASEATG
jgi:peptide/nickel transport system permease protein